MPVIAKRIEAKAAKHYQPKINLLVYVNQPLFTQLQLTDQQAMDLVGRWHDRFSSVWLLWSANAVAGPTQRRSYCAIQLHGLSGQALRLGG